MLRYDFLVNFNQKQKKKIPKFISSVTFHIKFKLQVTFLDHVWRAHFKSALLANTKKYTEEIYPVSIILTRGWGIKNPDSIPI